MTRGAGRAQAIPNASAAGLSTFDVASRRQRCVAPDPSRPWAGRPARAATGRLKRATSSANVAREAPAPARLDQPVHDLQHRRELLHLVDDDRSAVGQRANPLLQPLRSRRQLPMRARVEQVQV